MECRVGSRALLTPYSEEVTARVLSQCAAGTMRAHVIDCRYPHEYEGGHVRGAVNVYDPGDLQKYLLSLMLEDQDRAQYMLQQNRGGGGGVGTLAGAGAGAATGDVGVGVGGGGGNAACGGPDESASGAGGAGAGWTQNSVFILYCDFSSERAPRMWRHVRNLDRRDHMMDYPALSFPHLYVLHGGWAGFLASQADSGEAPLCFFFLFSLHPLSSLFPRNTHLET